MTIRFLIASLFIGAVIVVFGLLEPAGSAWFPRCALHETTGLHCPGCGGTRALQALFDGKFALAARCNPLLTAGAVVFPPLLLWQRRLEGRGVFTPKVTWGIAIVVLAYFIGRNLPSPTTSPLAPPPLEEVRGGQESPRE